MVLGEKTTRGAKRMRLPPRSAKTPRSFSNAEKRRNAEVLHPLRGASTRGRLGKEGISFRPVPPFDARTTGQQDERSSPLSLRISRARPLVRRLGKGPLRESTVLPALPARPAKRWLEREGVRGSEGRRRSLRTHAPPCRRQALRRPGPCGRTACACTPRARPLASSSFHGPAGRRRP